MISAKKSWTILSLLAIFALLITACAPETVEVVRTVEVEKTVEVEVEKTVEVEKIVTATPEPVEERGTLRFAGEIEMGGKETLNPAAATRWQPPIWFVYDRLFIFDANGELLPRLAVSWEVDEAAQRWAFKLREGVVFHDGKPFTSADVVYTFENIFDPDLDTPVASVLDMIDPEQIETPDEHTVVFNLKSPFVDLPLLLADYRMGIIGEGSLPNIDENPNGTGPFKLVKRDIYGTSVFAAHDDYWDGKPGLAAIEFIGIADAQAQTQALLSGQTDVGFTVTLEEAELFEQDPDFELLEVVTGNWDGIVMDVRDPPFDDVRVREALKLVADRQEIIDVVLEGYGTVGADHPVWPGDGYHLELDPPHDVEKAKELLAEAGYPDGLDLELISSPVDPYFMGLAVVYKEQAAEAGINIEIKEVPADGYWSGEQGWMASPFFMTSWTQRPADQVLNEALGCEAPWNESRWCNEEFEQAIANARSELDAEERTRFYQEAQRLAAEDGGTILPYFRKAIYAVKKKVKGLPPIFFKQILWHEIYIEE